MLKSIVTLQASQASFCNPRLLYDMLYYNIKNRGVF